MEPFSGTWPFYVDDSYSLALTTTPQNIYPGCFNCNAVFTPGQIVFLEIDYAQLEMAVFDATSGGLDADVFAQIYDITNGTPAPCGGASLRCSPAATAKKAENRRVFRGLAVAHETLTIGD